MTLDILTAATVKFLLLLSGVHTIQKMVRDIRIEANKECSISDSISPANHATCNVATTLKSALSVSSKK